MQDIKAFMTDVQAAPNTLTLWTLGVAYFRVKGINLITYLHVPPMGASDYKKTQVFAHGFPKAWVDRYIEQRLFDKDPMPDLALKRADPYRWTDVGQLMTLTSEQRQYLRDVRNADLGDGLAIPVFGPGGRNGYVGLGFGDWVDRDIDHIQLKELQWVCQAAHTRYCELICERLQEPKRLSPQEKEVLQWVARGKSNVDISTIMTLSPNTVDTYLRRIFAKLNVADRVTAAVQGVGSGLISM